VGVGFPVAGFSTKRVGSSDGVGDVHVCSRCGRHTLICLGAWSHTLNGVSFGRPLRECRCQTCGFSVTLYDPFTLRVQWIASIVMLCSVVFAPLGLLGVLLLKGQRARWRDNPLAPDAPTPEIIYRLGPGDRRCARCGAAARLERMTRHRYGLHATGTDYDYACVACDHRFQTESSGGLVKEIVVGMSCTALGLFALGLDVGPEVRFGVSGLFLVIGAFALYQAVSHVLAALHNPPLSP
jgi:hypothetical protein